MITWHTQGYSTRPQYESSRYSILLKLKVPESISFR